MVAVTYGVARVGVADTGSKIAPKAATGNQAEPRKSWFDRFFDAMVQARMQQAQREIRMHTNFLPYSFDERGNRLIETKSGDMPLGGW